MDEKALRQLLEDVRTGSTNIDAAVERVRDLPFADLGFARVDHHRALRQGQPEVILGEPKTADQITAIAGEIMRRGNNVLITRLSAAKAEDVRKALPNLRYVEIAQVATIEVAEIQVRPQKVVIVTAGTGDIPMAEEASETLRMTGFSPVRLFDVGVAGIHRVLAYRDDLLHADAVIVVAGMEGALPSVVGGLVACPVIAVPTSVGYGTHLAGLTPMLAMLSSCASGVVVVNIDNGFGAAMAVHRMFLTRKRASELDT
ncbi:MAG: nickel pincer cofactor biosynthesis protein LarB [Myxococcota bacterium]